MAINFLNTVDLNKNQLNNAAIQNLAADPATGVLGQVYYNTTDSVLKICITANIIGPPAVNAVWQGVSGDVASVTASTVNNRLGIAITDPNGPDPVVGINIVGQTNLAATPASTDELLIYDVSTTTNKAITVANLVGGFETTYTLPVSAGTVAPNAPTTGIITLTGSDGTTDPVTFSGTTGRVNVSGAGSTITIDLTDDVSIVDDLNVGGVITQSGISSTTGANNGALVNTTALALAVANANIKVGMEVTGTGVPTNITIASITDTTNFVLSSAISIADATALTFTEINSFAAALDLNNNKLQEVKTGVLGTDGVNLAQVELLVAGVGVFKGGYNATTDPGVPVISGTSNIALDLGDYFVVSHDGDITFSDQVVSVEVGDFIFANAAITAASNTASTEYTFVQADANIAGAGATDGATEKGVAGFDSANFTVTASGWVQLDNQKNPYGRKQSLNNTSPSSRAEAGGVTTFTLDLADASLFGTGALSSNIAVEVTQIATPFQTVYAEVTRSGTASMAIAFTGSISNDVYQVLLTHI